MDLNRKMQRQFWVAHAPLIILSGVIMWLVWYVMFGNDLITWLASAVPIFGGIAYVYPCSKKNRGNSINAN